MGLFDHFNYIQPENPVTLVMGWIGSLNVHLDVFSFGVHCIFDC